MTKKLIALLTAMAMMMTLFVPCVLADDEDEEVQTVVEVLYIEADGEQVKLGGNESYVAMCHKCYMKALAKSKKI